MTRATDWYQDLGDTPPSVGGDQCDGVALSGRSGSVAGAVTDAAEHFAGAGRIEAILGVERDISIIKIDGPSDQGPWYPVGR